MMLKVEIVRIRVAAIGGWLMIGYYGRGRNEVIESWEKGVMCLMLSEIEIPSSVEWILDKLNAGGFEAYAVGGCVRDTVLFREPGDWDITTSAKPEQVKMIFGRTIDTGLEHGTVTVMKDGVGYEVTTYRVDGDYRDGRHPDCVEFTSDLKEDLRRRDFTINAMAYSRHTGIVDIFGGMDDIEKRMIRCVGDPMERFAEDALRILRAIRFSAQLDFDIESETLKAISRIAPNLVHVSKERVQVELTKLLMSSHPEKIALIYETGISRYISEDFHRIWPGAGERGACPAASRYRDGISAGLSAGAGLRVQKALRWAGFLSLTDADGASRILKDLKMDNDTIRRVTTLVKFLDFPVTGEKKELRKVMSEMEDELFDDLLDLKMAWRPQDAAAIRHMMKLRDKIRDHGDCIRLKDLAVNGGDLIALGAKQGKQVGEILSSLFVQVLEEEGKNDREYLLGETRRMIGTAGRSTGKELK